MEVLLFQILDPLKLQTFIFLRYIGRECSGVQHASAWTRFFFFFVRGVHYALVHALTNTLMQLLSWVTHCAC